MKILHYHWASYLENDIFETYKAMNISYDTFEWLFHDKNIDENFLSFSNNSIDLKNYDALFSINYWPLLSTICYKSGIPYIAWCYDNPLNVRKIDETLGNETNYIFCFDRIQTENYRNLGYNTVFHMPLGINANRYSQIVPTRKYASDVSFVGKLYESAALDIMAISDSYSQGYMQSIINVQQELYNGYIIDELLTNDFIKHLNNYFLQNKNPSNFQISKQELSYALSCEVTRRDRIMLLSLCGSRFKTKFYSYNDNSIITGVIKCPPVDYFKEMPYVFSSSKINLNPALRAIQSGISLRAFDIMASGGFLLSSYKDEYYDFFTPDIDLVMYDSLENAIEKINYYLTHDELRSAISISGRNNVLTYHNLKIRLSNIFKIVGI